MNAQVVCVSSRVPTEPYYHWREFVESLRRFAETPTNLGEGAEWRGLMTKPYLLREWLRAGNNTSDRLIVCDAWDIVFVKHPHWVGDRCEEWFGDAVVFNGEKGCWPRSDLECQFPDDGSPWRFLNSGFFCGPSDGILAILEAMDIDAIGFDPPGGPYPNDQGEYQALFCGERHGGKRIVYQGLPEGAEDFAHVRRLPSGEDRVQPAPMVIDSQCRVSQTLSACEPSEFDFSGEYIRNVMTGTEPGVFHLNGGAKEAFGPLIYGKYGL